MSEGTCYLCGHPVPLWGWYDDAAHDCLGIDCENPECGRYDVRLSDWRFIQKFLERLRPLMMFRIKLWPKGEGRPMLDRAFVTTTAEMAWGAKAMSKDATNDGADLLAKAMRRVYEEQVKPARMGAVRIGDLVQHPSIGTPMKVEQVNGDAGSVDCVWTENGREKRCGFVLEVLEHCR